MRANANDADLNRNFPGIQGDEYPDGLPRQPETWAQMDFLGSINMVMGANIHGGKEVVNYPFDSWPDLHADDAWYIRTSEEYAGTVQERAVPILYMMDLDSGITNGWQWYEAVGTRQDWVNYFNHAREVTLEISREKDPPAGDLPYLWYYNYPAMLRYMQHSMFGIHGIVRDEDTGTPLKAMISIPGHDRLNSEVYSDSSCGYFARPIEAGAWSLEVLAQGYEPKTLSDISSAWGEVTWLDISLKAHSLGMGEKLSVRISPNPVQGRTELSIQLNAPGRCRIFLYDLNGRLLLERQYHFTNPGRHKLPVDIRHLKPGIYILRLLSDEGSFSGKILKSQ
jgi:hypothetical protein